MFKITQINIPRIIFFFTLCKRYKCNDCNDNYSVVKNDEMVDFELSYREFPPYTHFGTWKKPSYMKFVLVGL